MPRYLFSKCKLMHRLLACGVARQVNS